MDEERADVSDAQLEFIDFAMNHAFNSIAKGGPLVPFTVCERVGERDLQRHIAGGSANGSFDLGKSVEEAKASARMSRADRVVVVYDGRIGDEDGGKHDAIVVEAFERGSAFTMVLAQRYKPGGLLRRLQLIGDTMMIGQDEPLY